MSLIVKWYYSGSRFSCKPNLAHELRLTDRLGADAIWTEVGALNSYSLSPNFPQPVRTMA